MCWFQGDTLQGVESELRCVSESGFYRFHFSSSVDYASGSIQLAYTPHIYQNLGEVMETPSLAGMVIWTEEQISDFVRKLGFLDAEGNTASLIKQFLHLNQVRGTIMYIETLAGSRYHLSIKTTWLGPLQLNLTSVQRPSLYKDHLVGSQKHLEFDSDLCTETTSL